MQRVLVMEMEKEEVCKSYDVTKYFLLPKLVVSARTLLLFCADHKNVGRWYWQIQFALSNPD